MKSPCRKTDSELECLIEAALSNVDITKQCTTCEAQRYRVGFTLMISSVFLLLLCAIFFGEQRGHSLTMALASLGMLLMGARTVDLASRLENSRQL